MTGSPLEPPFGPPPRRRRPRYAGTHPRRFDQRYKERDPAKYPDMDAHVRAQGRTPAGTHVPIMVAEVLAALRPAAGEIVADLTVGYGGHALAFLERTAPDGRLIGLDLDGPQLEATRRRLAQVIAPARLHLHHSHFAGLPKVLAAEGLTGVDIVFADLGLSSMKIDDPARGFSYKHDGPLDMRMDPRRPRNAADVLRTIAGDELARALHELADEPAHQQIAGGDHPASVRTAHYPDTGVGGRGATDAGPDAADVACCPRGRASRNCTPRPAHFRRCESW